jgi:molybdopterin converting factor small subunit
MREAAGTGVDEIAADTVAQLIDQARLRYGQKFSDSLPFTSIAVNGTLVSELEGEQTPIAADDEVAFLPPVSGGSRRSRICRPNALR